MHTSSSETTPPNIILVTFDALTARDMSLYGYHRPTTPFIDRWAKNASVFTGAHAASSYTSPTTASLMTGKRVWSHMLYQPHGYMIRNNDTENLPLLLSKAGYYNIALVQNKYTPLKAFSDHFDVVHPMSDFKISNSLTSYIDDGLYKYFAGKIIIYDWVIREDFIFRRFADFLFKFLPDPLRYEYPADKVFSAFLWHIRNEPPQPFFAWLHIFPPHAPYIAPAPYRGMFDSSSKIRTSEKLKGDKSKRFDIARAKYDELIRYCDNEFENFIEKLTEQTKNTVIILSADHGESFEHDFIGHGFYLYEQITNIPLIIKGPDQTEGRIVNGLVEQIDIAPTILEFANIPVAPWMEGRSLLPVIQGKDFPSVPIFSMDLQENHSEEKIQHGVFSVWEDEYKLIHYLDDNKSLLFNLSDDPGEMNNIIDRNAETGKRLLTMIHDNLKKANERISVVD
ncbi:MAG: sulfatase [Nitrospirae bacterium]|nr:sulfatase [Nitrospirota bacterium]